MTSTIFQLLDRFDDILWGYICFPIIVAIGIYFSYHSKLIQVRKFPVILKTFFGFIGRKRSACDMDQGVHPLKASFACIGASVGIGNIVSIITAVEIGGPGALFWVWITAIVGSLVKYAEVCLGMQFRVPEGGNSKGGFSGGPMYYLERAFSSWAVKVFCLLMCLYGAEILQFNVVVASISENFEISKWWVAIALVGLVLIAEVGGVDRVGTICAAIIPAFIAMYLCMGLYVLAMNLPALPGVLFDIVRCAFTPAAAIGGFAGSTLMTTISQGIRRSCYSSDIGVGYASIIHSESREKNPAKQASLTIFEVFLDIFVICTMSVLIVLTTGVWCEGGGSANHVQRALSQYFPYMHIFMPFFLFLLGYSTIITYFCAGMKTACFLFPRYGRFFYCSFGALAFLFFTFQELTQATTVMSLVLACLLLLNLTAIWRLRKYVRYNIDAVEAPAIQNT